MLLKHTAQHKHCQTQQKREVTLKLRPYGAIQICLLLLLFANSSQPITNKTKLNTTKPHIHIKICLLCPAYICNPDQLKNGKGSPYSIAERRVLELIPVLGNHPAGEVSHKSGGKLPLLSTRPAVTLATLKRAATNFSA